MSLLRSRWFTFALLACVLLLLLSVNGIEGKKKKKGEKKVVEEKEQPKQVKNQAPTYTAEECKSQIYAFILFLFIFEFNVCPLPLIFLPLSDILFIYCMILYS